MLPLILLGIGFGAGVLGALLGVGGGVILVPALIFLADLPFGTAVGTSLVCVVATSVAGSAVHFTRGGVSVDAAVPLQAFAVAGAVAAGLGAPYLPVTGLHIAFAVMLLYAAWRAWPRPQRTTGFVQPHPLIGRLGAGAGGAVASLLGVGGGIVFTPLLHLVLGLDFHRAAATSVYLIGLTAASGALVYLARGDVAMTLVGPTMLGILIGATVGSAGARRIAATWLGRAFAVLLVYVAVRMLLRGLSGA